MSMTRREVLEIEKLVNQSLGEYERRSQRVATIINDAVQVSLTKLARVDITVAKTQPDKQLVFGWASVCEIGGELVIDKQEDIILPEDLEKAAYEFVLYSRTHGDMHIRKGTGRLVESIVFTKEKQDALGIDLGMVGWWVGFKVDDQDLWKRIRAGDLPEFSIAGKAVRVPRG